MPGSWKAVLAVAILLAGCSSKHNTAPPAEAFSVTSDGTVHDYQYPGYNKATVKVGVKFTSTSSKTCLLDSLEIKSPNDSVLPGKQAILKTLWLDTLASGDTTSREFTIADSRTVGRDPGAAPYPPGRGRYYLRAWGRWDGTTHESPQYSWTW